MHRNIPRSKIVKAFSKLGKPTSIKKIYETNNIIYKVVVNKVPYILKVYATKAPGVDREILISQNIPNMPHSRKLVDFSLDKELLGAHYAIFPYIEGTSLHEEMDKGLSKEKAKKYAEAVADIIKAIAKIKVNGYGFLDENLNGTEKDAFTSMYKLFKEKDVPVIEKYLPKEFIDKVDSALQILNRNAKPTLEPYDLNSHNFLVSNGEIKMIDIGAIFSGDELFPLGEFMGHYYLTPLWDPFIKCFKLSLEEMKIVHAFALHSNFDVLRAAIVMAGADYKTAKPWGNKHTFLELMDLHLKALDSGDY